MLLYLLYSTYSFMSDNAIFIHIRTPTRTCQEALERALEVLSPGQASRHASQLCRTRLLGDFGAKSSQAWRFQGISRLLEASKPLGNNETVHIQYLQGPWSLALIAPFRKDADGTWLATEPASRTSSPAYGVDFRAYKGPAAASKNLENIRPIVIPGRPLAF